MENEVQANGYEYDAERYDPEAEDTDHCQKCGAELKSYGLPYPCVRCPECEVLVVAF
jgi:hypothetical protein